MKTTTTNNNNKKKRKKEKSITHDGQTFWNLVIVASLLTLLFKQSMRNFQSSCCLYFWNIEEFLEVMKDEDFVQEMETMIYLKASAKHTGCSTRKVL